LDVDKCTAASFSMLDFGISNVEYLGSAITGLNFLGKLAV
jgi:hypothetical protein